MNCPLCKDGDIKVAIGEWLELQAAMRTMIRATIATMVLEMWPFEFIAVVWRHPLECAIVDIYVKERVEGDTDKAQALGEHLGLHFNVIQAPSLPRCRGVIEEQKNGIVVLMER